MHGFEMDRCWNHDRSSVPLDRLCASSERRDQRRPSRSNEHQHSHYIRHRPQINRRARQIMHQPPRSSSAAAALLSIVLSLLLAFTLSCQASHYIRHRPQINRRARQIMHQPPRSSSAAAALLSIVLSLLLAFTLSCQAFLQQPARPSWTVRWQQQRQQERTLTRRAAGGSNAEGKKEFFRLSQGRMEFGTVDRVEMVLYEEADVIHQYISESPDRVILATWDEELVKRQSRDVFRLTTKPLQFITLSLQPSIDVKVSTGEKALWVESLAHSMNGAERLLGQSFAESLKIEVKGKLHAVPGKQGPGLTTLVGDVQFFTSGQLPLLFSLTPRPVLETAAVAINRRIMGYAKGKFVENLARDFDAWAAASASWRKQPPPPPPPPPPQQQQQQRKAAG